MISKKIIRKFSKRPRKGIQNNTIINFGLTHWDWKMPNICLIAFKNDFKKIARKISKRLRKGICYVRRFLSKSEHRVSE